MSRLKNPLFAGAKVLPDSEIREADLSKAVVLEREDTRPPGCADVIVHQRPDQ
jgi:hypothetical protein